MTSNDAPFPEQRRGAFLAASQAANAVAELLRFADEGPASDMAFHMEEPVEKLAEAVKLAAEVELAFWPENDAGSREQFGQLIAACASFLGGWAG